MRFCYKLLRFFSESHLICFCCVSAALFNVKINEYEETNTYFIKLKYLCYCSRCRSHVFTIDEDVHGVVAAPLHANTVPNLRNNPIQ